MSAGYEAAYAAWRRDPEGWWEEAAEALKWDRRWDRTFDPALGAFGQWFAGGRLNVCANALDRHVDAGRGGQAALIWDSPATGQRARFTYAELRDHVARLAGALATLGVGQGDRVVIYMPMVPEAVMAMLACARLGAIHSVVFGGFAAAELAKRIEDARPRAVISASCGIEPGRLVAYKPLLDEAIALSAHKPERCLILQRPMLRADLVPGRDSDLAEAMATAAPRDPVSVAATDPLYILYTSGTTGKPKGIVRDAGGYAAALLKSMGMIYGVGTGDTYWCASDVGWVVGHSYIVYGPLLAGCTTLLYEGKPVGTPDAGAFWRVCAEHAVRAFFTAPTAIRAIKQQDPDARLMAAHDLSQLQTLFLAGERCDPPTAVWAAEHLGKPVVDHWWQTETGWPVTAGFRGLGLFPFKPGSGGRPAPGYELQALDNSGQPVPRGAQGNLALRLPLPPGFAPTLWSGDESFRSAYLADFPGWYRTGDAGEIDADGDVWIMGRTDDIINVAGHRLSTGQIEEVLASHPDVAECAVVGAADPLKGQVPLGLVVLKAGAAREEPLLVQELVQLVRERIGPVAAFKRAQIVPRLPKTRSGKILRASIRRLADGQDPAPPPTIDDPAALDEVRDALARLDPPGGGLVCPDPDRGPPDAPLAADFPFGARRHAARRGACPARRGAAGPAAARLAVRRLDRWPVPGRARPRHRGMPVPALGGLRPGRGRARVPDPAGHDATRDRDRERDAEPCRVPLRAAKRRAGQHRRSARPGRARLRLRIARRAARPAHRPERDHLPRLQGLPEPAGALPITLAGPFTARRASPAARSPPGSPPGAPSRSSGSARR